MKKMYRFLRINSVVVGLVFIVVIILILNGREFRATSTRSAFSAAKVLAFAFFAEPTSVRIVDAFESVFAFALRLSLNLTGVNTWMLDDESFGNSVKATFVTD